MGGGGGGGGGGGDISKCHVKSMSDPSCITVHTAAVPVHRQQSLATYTPQSQL